MIIETLLLKEISIFPELFLGIALVYLVLHGSFLSMRNSYPLIQTSMVYLGALILTLSIVLILNDKLHVLDLGILNNTIANDYTSFSSKLSVGLLSLICLLMIHPYLISHRLNQFEYVLLFLFSVLGLFLLCSSNDLITAYLAIELQTLSFYVLAAFNRNSTFSMDAGIKYFILGSLSSGLFLFGSSLLYGISGSVNFSELKDLFMHTMPEIKSEDPTNLMMNSFSELYYHSLLMSQFKYDLSLSLGSNFEGYSLKNFSLIKEELLNFNLKILIDQVCAFNIILSKYNYILLSLIINLKDYELGFLLYELYNFKDLSGLSDDSGFLMILSVCEITKSYLSASLVPLNLFDASLIQFSLLFILISLFFKLSIVPFHAWAPDVYEGSPSSSTFFFAVVPKIAVFVLMLRIFYFSFYGFLDSWRYIIVCAIILTVLVGSFGGLEQRKLKSLLVYSSISHMGYSLIVFSSGTFDNLQILFCYLIVYSFSGLCIWSIFIFTRVKNNRLKKQNKDLTDLVSLSKSNYTLATFLSVILFSVAGFPPMIGFLVKINVFSTAIESSMYFVALVSILCSVVATFYYIRMVKIMYFEKTIVGKLYYPINTEKVLILASLLWFSLLLFINPTLLFLFSHKFGLLFSTSGF
tara:strand:- start:13036 stop:14949 length:1914 start_codon:yes stop_codon:yes gene_type:complete